MANTDKNCFVSKLANTLGREMRVERNSSMGMAMWTVADILDRFSNTSGSSLYIEPDIWKMKAVSATMETLLLVLDNSPHSKHLISLVLRSWSRFLL